MHSYSSAPAPTPGPNSSAPKNIAVLIATHEPDRSLELLIDRLIEAQISAILLVDDGTSVARRRIFDRIAMQPTVHLLRHDRCEGKGVALKAGLRYFLRHFRHYEGLVTAEACSPKTAEDVVRVARALHRAPHLAILGSRRFDRDVESYIGWSERLGNRAMAFLFRALTGVPVEDTQTGLRGLPTGLLPQLLELPGNRYDYGMAALMHIVWSGYPLAEQSVSPVSHDGNGDQAFRRIRDSFGVLRAMLCAPKPVSCCPDFGEGPEVGVPAEKHWNPARAIAPSGPLL